MAARHSQLQVAAQRYLRSLGHYVAHIKTTAVRRTAASGREFWSRGLLTPGTPDLMGGTADGRWLCVEIKISPDRLRPAQVAFKAEVEKRGGLYLVCRDTVDALIQAHKGGSL